MLADDPDASFNGATATSDNLQFISFVAAQLGDTLQARMKLDKLGSKAAVVEQMILHSALKRAGRHVDDRRRNTWRINVLREPAAAFRAVIVFGF
jgi:hypothetical protein